MTVAGLIERYNSERPNTVEDSTKRDWLKVIESELIDTVYLTHEDCPENLDLHMELFDMNTDLLLPITALDVYMYYLDERIAINTNDMKRYNVVSQLFNNEFLNFKQRYNKEHMPLTTHGKYIKHEDL